MIQAPLFFRLIRSLPFQKLLKRRATIGQEATPKTGQKIIHRCRQRPSFQIDQFVPQVVGLLKLGDQVFDLYGSSRIELSKGWIMGLVRIRLGFRFGHGNG